MHSKKLMKPLCIIALFGSILLLLSSCNFNELKRFGLGVLTGNPIKDNDTELQTIEVVDNPNNYYIKDDETSEAVFKYTIEKSYFINDLSEASLSIDDFPNSNGKTEYFTSDGKLIDNNLQLLCIELSIEKQSERKRSYTGTEDENIHILENIQTAHSHLNQQYSPSLYIRKEYLYNAVNKRYESKQIKQIKTHLC